MQKLQENDSMPMKANLTVYPDIFGGWRKTMKKVPF
jgi:hypothetical protein